jgi:hypothetical protein
MALIRKYAKLGHAVPKGYRSPQGPFPPEIFQAPIKVLEEHRSDSLHEALDNVRMFFCRDCGDVLYEEELTGHECPEQE